MAKTATPTPAPVSAAPAPVETRDSPADAEAFLNLFQTVSKAEQEQMDTAPIEPEPEAPAPTPSETPEPASEEPETAEETPDEEAPTEEVPEEPDLETVVVDGETLQVTRAELKAGYSRTADYTRKTQAVADDRRRLEAETAQVRADRERYTKGLADVEALLMQDAAEPDWVALADQVEPVEFNKTRAQWDTRMKRVHALRRQREDLERQGETERQAARAEQVRQEQALLFSAIPAWKDRAVAEDEARQIVDYALKAGESYGVTPESVSEITTAFPMLVLRKAMLYDRMMSAKPKVVAQKIPTPTAKPGAKVTIVKPSRSAQAFAKLAETGDPKAFEEYILDRLTASSTR